MNLKRLAKIERELGELQRAPHGRKPRIFEQLAKKLGRTKVNRGSEPNYASPAEPDLGPPLSIPHHDSLKVGTALSIVNTLQSDVDIWRQHLEQIEDTDRDAVETNDEDDIDDEQDED